MLILTRRIGEALMINDDITITVLNVRGQQVRLGINAPKSVTVHREEIYQRINNEKNPILPGMNDSSTNSDSQEKSSSPEDSHLEEASPGNYLDTEKHSSPDSNGNTLIEDGIPENWRD